MAESKAEQELRKKIAIRLAKWKADIIYTTEHHFDVLPSSPVNVTEDIIPIIKEAGYVQLSEDQPKIVCLCGSTRFVEIFNEWQKKLTIEGKIVLSIEIVTSQSQQEDPQHTNLEVKAMLDELHLRKIDLADEVFVINVGGYIGESTAREIAYAEKIGKPVKYLEQASGG